MRGCTNISEVILSISYLFCQCIVQLYKYNDDVLPLSLFFLYSKCYSFFSPFFLLTKMHVWLSFINESISLPIFLLGIVQFGIPAPISFPSSPSPQFNKSAVNSIHQFWNILCSSISSTWSSKSQFKPDNKIWNAISLMYKIIFDDHFFLFFIFLYFGIH